MNDNDYNNNNRHNNINNTIMKVIKTLTRCVCQHIITKTSPKTFTRHGCKRLRTTITIPILEPSLPLNFFFPEIRDEGTYLTSQ